MRKTILILFILVLTLPLIACGGSQDTPAPSDPVAEEPIIEEPTEEPAPAVPEANFVTSFDQIAGTWISAADLGTYIILIDEEGMFRVAASNAELEQGSTDSWRLTFEDDQIKATGFALCLGETGYYLATLNPDGTLKFSTISDTCTSRIRRMDRSLPGRLTPYNLIYHRVE